MQSILSAIVNAIAEAASFLIKILVDGFKAMVEPILDMVVSGVQSFALSASRIVTQALGSLGSRAGFSWDTLEGIFNLGLVELILSFLTVLITLDVIFMALKLTPTPASPAAWIGEVAVVSIITGFFVQSIMAFVMQNADLRNIEPVLITEFGIPAGILDLLASIQGFYQAVGDLSDGMKETKAGLRLAMESYIGKACILAAMSLMLSAVSLAVSLSMPDEQLIPLAIDVMALVFAIWSLKLLKNGISDAVSLAAKVEPAAEKITVTAAMAVSVAAVAKDIIGVVGIM